MLPRHAAGRHPRGARASFVVRMVRPSVGGGPGLERVHGARHVAHLRPDDGAVDHHAQVVRQPRLLRVGLYTLAGEAVSDTHELYFDRDSSNPRERELAVRLILGRKADGLNNQEVELRLEEAVEGTSHYSRYQTLRYTIRRAITGDFDF